MDVPCCQTVLPSFSSKFMVPFCENFISNFLFPQTSYIPFLLPWLHIQLTVSPLISLKKMKSHKKELTHLLTTKSTNWPGPVWSPFSSHLLIILTLSIALSQQLIKVIDLSYHPLLTFSLYMCLCPNFPFFMSTPVIRSHPSDLTLSWLSLYRLSPNKVTFWGTDS